jgi:hypothetical protein
MMNCIGFLFLLIPIEDETVSCTCRAFPSTSEDGVDVGRGCEDCCVSAGVGPFGARFGRRERKSAASDRVAGLGVRIVAASL